jgi:Domain of unknown function (DUF4391)
MDFSLPRQSELNKFIPKNTFFKQGASGTKIKDDFATYISKITWRYKLSEMTIGIQKTPRVEEIQIFQIDLKERKIPQNALKTIDALISYPILYVLVYEWEVAYGIMERTDLAWKYYFSDWWELLEFQFDGHELTAVYENIVRQFIKLPHSDRIDYKTLILADQKITQWEKEILALKNKIRTEKQFNKKVELNTQLADKLLEIESTKNSLLIP